MVGVYHRVKPLENILGNFQVFSFSKDFSQQSLSSFIRVIRNSIDFEHHRIVSLNYGKEGIYKGVHTI